MDDLDAIRFVRAMLVDRFNLHYDLNTGTICVKANRHTPVHKDADKAIEAFTRLGTMIDRLKREVV